MLGPNRFLHAGEEVNADTLTERMVAATRGQTEPSAEPVRIVVDASMPWKDAFAGVVAMLQPPGRRNISVASRDGDDVRETSIPVISSHLCRALHVYDGEHEFDGHVGGNRYVFVNAWLDDQGHVTIDDCTFEDLGESTPIELDPVPDALATGAPLRGSTLDLPALRRWFDQLAKRDVRPLLALDHESDLSVGHVIGALADAKEALGTTRVLLGPNSREPELEDPEWIEDVEVGDDDDPADAPFRSEDER